MTEIDYESTEYERLFDYQRWYKRAEGHSQSTVIILSKEEIETVRPFLRPFSSVDVDKSELQSIQMKINGSTTPLPWFVRLTSRSPKDSGNCKADHPKEVLKILCESERVKIDLEDYYQDNDEIGIVLQPWNPNITLQDELRLFIYFNTIVAISPIDEYSGRELFPEDVVFIEQFFFNNKELWKGFRDFIVDISFDRRTKQIVFIELNPYGPLSDSMTFD
eukprot:TRINITY_DN11527_c0_g2_i5.p1 TRINITY_DN11527_c0_g2~~TRINITY_DN11527_c0_g2_i5.p1  ORF type:complete len:220 (-),score=36.54 TRINITY_DN11527_c0_g2_i5:149-808(-)